MAPAVATEATTTALISQRSCLFIERSLPSWSYLVVALAGEGSAGAGDAPKGDNVANVA
jgi:hypothetical protein